MHPIRPGFTLFEIAISLVIIAIAIVSAGLAYPAGIKAQHLARFQVYAGVKMLELMDHWSNDSHTRWERQTEAERIGQCTFMRWPVDLDRMLENPVLGLLPLPHALASRIDSDDDEIARLLAEGGTLFFVAPRIYEAGFDMRVSQDADHEHAAVGAESAAPTESQTLVFAVLGYAQQNALPNHPCVAWPYFEFYPAPAQPWERDSWRLNAWPHLAEFESLYDAVNGDTYHAKHADPAAIDDYVAKAAALVSALGLPMTPHGAIGDAPQLPADLATVPVPWPATAIDAYPRPHQVLAMRFLAHAVAARTGSALPPHPDAAFAAYADACHEACLAWAMRYASTSPYDWGAPRPLNRQTCFDFPLLEYDLFSPPRAVGDGTGDVSRPIIAGAQPTNHGQARGVYGWGGSIPANAAEIASSWGDHAHFNLTERFAAAERTRRLACWSVDWRSFEDCESVASDPCDANMHFLDSRGVCVSAERSGYTPDLKYHFSDATRTATCRQIDKGTMMSGPRAAWDTAAFKEAYLGLHGADRNGNGAFDRGPLPASSRLRATSVAAVDFYDRRLISSLRN
ncbi:MAG TPA: prepilin-type N-terminal cleavage/methylation domain-containing protein [Planctomycetota bacterium]|nr:prepilin-type N-terminal cleavage/methylation domain-containing protein [Planctomycetota bacterium]